MTKEFWTVKEVKEVFQIDEKLVGELEEVEILCPICENSGSEKLFSQDEMEKLRLTKILIEDMGVNLEGVEVILRMRQNMIDLRRQFDAILEDLALHVQELFREGS